jgi:hypothetical protein
MWAEDDFIGAKKDYLIQFLILMSKFKQMQSNVL